MDLSSGVNKAISAAGGLRPLARAPGISHSAIIQWSRIPAERIITIEEITGVCREELRPDLYR